MAIFQFNQAVCIMQILINLKNLQAKKRWLFSHAQQALKMKN
jgi:hypothetical protein